ncbi:hypothetical protein LCGC14_0476770 [marine sediment metagenome]|uniref:Uncharacterized protein n=1 Tax=marine sediment metagenome TaxID=412755 RepID=A0A0F9SFZ6_9ZZZZ
MKTIKQLEEEEKKMRKVTNYNKPLHSFTYNELHQRILGSLEQTNEIIKMIEEWHSEYGYGEVDKVDINELLTKLRGDGK